MSERQQFLLLWPALWRQNETASLRKGQDNINSRLHLSREIHGHHEDRTLEHLFLDDPRSMDINLWQQRALNWTSLRDLEKPRALLVGQVPAELELPVDAVDTAAPQ
jgi:hypothetical protein